MVGEHEAPKATRSEPENKECHGELDAQRIKAIDDGDNGAKETIISVVGASPA